MLTLNEAGRIEMGQKTTRPKELPFYYVGGDTCLISFAFMLLTDGRVVLHSLLTEALTDTQEDFLYEVVDRHEAVETLCTMIEDAAQHVVGLGYNLDMNDTPLVLVDHLTQELQTGLH